MNRIISSLIFLSALVSTECLAKVNGLLNWQENNVNVILPEIEGKSPGSIPELYIHALESAESYKPFRPFFSLSTPVQVKSIADHFEPGKVTILEENKSELSNTQPIPFAIIASEPAIMNPKSKPYQHFNQSFASAGASIYVIPFGIDALLNQEEDLKSYLTLISHRFPALLAPGGDDVDPSLYGETNKGSVDTQPSRDKLEIKVIQTFTTQGEGVFYGICRGHQAYAIAMGGSMIQDLPVDLSPQIIHRPTKNPDGTLASSWHSISLMGTENALFQAVGKDTFLVNSRHHQAVKSIPAEKGEVIATAGGNVIEAIEKKDPQGHYKVLTFQFHPEDMNTEESDKIIKFMINQARETQKSHQKPKTG